MHRATLLTAGLCWGAVATAQTPAELSPAASGPAVTTQPSAPPAPARQPYDLWTTKALTGDWGGARTALQNDGLTFSLSYQSQFQQNFRGGLNTQNANAFTGTYDFVIKADFDKMKLIPGGQFYIKAKGSYNRSINASDVGALGNVNADAFRDEAIYVNKWWWRQYLWGEKIELRAGRLQIDKDLFDISLYANDEDFDFLNRGSIRNLIAPFANSIGAFAKFSPVPWFYFQAAGYDAQVRSPTRTGFDTAFHQQAWFAGVWEFGFLPKWESIKGPMPGSYRFGWSYNPLPKTVFEDRSISGASPDVQTGDVGLYAGLDQMVFKEQDDPKDTQGLGLFGRFGFAHPDVNMVSYYWEAGASYKGLIPTRDADTMGLAVVQSILSTQYRNEIDPYADRETIYEWYYAIQITPWCVLTPDLQFITNPGGDTTDRNSIVGALRLRINF